ncbi:TPA: hypothetical protein ACSC6I_002312 [Providencia rettgeri]|uniref:hypothetical protein n=1 Tax=Providencia rettgeri TaxID=587 RepID=UPI0023630EF7|nr:hypothetical protein [Providencia rettgeri]
MSLAIIILLIILVPAIPFFCLLKKRKWKFWLDESSLHVQPLFWFLVFLPLIISGIAWVLVAQDYELDVSTNGYSRLMENAKFPFLILALSPILGAFVTSAHRSLQTELQIKTAKEQLEEAQKKNKVDIYLSTRKYILEQLGMINFNGNEIGEPNTLYKKAFRKISIYEDTINTEFHKRTNIILSEIIVSLDGVFNANSERLFLIYEKKSFLLLKDYRSRMENIEPVKRLSRNIDMLRQHLGLSTCKEIMNNFDRIHQIYSNDVLEKKEVSTKYVLKAFINDVIYEIEMLIFTVSEITTILLIDGSLEEHLPMLESLRAKNQQVDMANIGDKLAAENQNPPE